MASIPSLYTSNPITPTVSDLVPGSQNWVAWASTWQSVYNLFKGVFDTVYPAYALTTPDFYKYKIVTSVATGTLTVALKNYLGTDPTALVPVKYQDGSGTVRTISNALSISAASGTNWLSLWNTELATLEQDIFAYLRWNSVDNTTNLIISRIPSATTSASFWILTAEKGLIATGTSTAADTVVNIGRFNTILSAGVAYTWSIPGTSLILNYPIFNTRLLPFASVVTGYSANPTATYYVYKLTGTSLYAKIREGTAGTSNATTTTYTIPFTESGVARWTAPTTIVDNGATPTTPGLAQIATSTNIISMFKDYNSAVWTASGTKRIQDCNIYMEI